ncbi:MAG: hypothetical protein AAB573_05105 [Patescibacteria group bacterium]
MKNGIQNITPLFIRDLATPNPRRDWTAAVGASIVIGLVLTLYSGWTFYRVTTGSLVNTSVVPTKPAPPITTAEMEAIREIYRVRESRFLGGAATTTTADPRGASVPKTGDGAPTTGN